jgi:cysteinyl-tRNA synthetase
MVNLALEGQISNKMAKSLGNVLDVERAVDLHGRNAVRMWLLQSHYSQPIDYSEEILEEKKRAYWRLQNLYANIIDSTSSSELSKQLTTQLRKRFDIAMKDDLNTPEALSALFEVAKEASREISARPEARQEFAELKEAFDELMGTILGFELGRAQTIFVEPLTSAVEFGQATKVNVTWRLGPEQEDPGQKTRDKVSLREKARSEKDWSLADRLRDELHAEGWVIEDTPEGPIVSRR